MERLGVDHGLKAAQVLAWGPSAAAAELVDLVGKLKQVAEALLTIRVGDCQEKRGLARNKVHHLGIDARRGQYVEDAALFVGIELGLPAELQRAVADFSRQSSDGELKFAAARRGVRHTVWSAYMHPTKKAGTGHGSGTIPAWIAGAITLADLSQPCGRSMFPL